MTQNAITGTGKIDRTIFSRLIRTNDVARGEDVAFSGRALVPFFSGRVSAPWANAKNSLTGSLLEGCP